MFSGEDVSGDDGAELGDRYGSIGESRSGQLRNWAIGMVVLVRVGRGSPNLEFSKTKK